MVVLAYCRRKCNGFILIISHGEEQVLRGLKCDRMSWENLDFKLLQGGGLERGV